MLQPFSTHVYSFVGRWLAAFVRYSVLLIISAWRCPLKLGNSWQFYRRGRAISRHFFFAHSRFVEWWNMKHLKGRKWCSLLRCFINLFNLDMRVWMCFTPPPPPHLESFCLELTLISISLSFSLSLSLSLSLFSLSLSLFLSFSFPIYLFIPSIILFLYTSILWNIIIHFL